MLRLFVCLTVTMLVPAAAVADGISISQSIDRSEIAFEETARFTITLTWNGPQSAYLFDRPLQPGFERLKVREFSSSVGSTGSGADELTTKTYEYTLVPRSAGTGRIDPVIVSYLTWPDSVSGRLVTEVMTVNIAPPLPPEPEGGFSWWLIIVGAAVVAGAVVVVILLTRRPKSAEPVVTPVDRFLESLEKSRAASGNDIKRFQDDLYRHLLEYLRVAHGVAGGDSAQAVVDQLAAAGLSDSARERIAAWLLTAERAKFTPVTAGPGETTRLAADIREFFEKQKSTRT